MVLEGLETEAREGRIGLWADPQPVPWKWRKGKPFYTTFHPSLPPCCLPLPLLDWATLRGPYALFDSSLAPAET